MVAEWISLFLTHLTVADRVPSVSQLRCTPGIFCFATAIGQTMSTSLSHYLKTLKQYAIYINISKSQDNATPYRVSHKHFTSGKLKKRIRKFSQADRKSVRSRWCWWCCVCMRKGSGCVFSKQVFVLANVWRAFFFSNCFCSRRATEKGTARPKRKVDTKEVFLRWCDFLNAHHSTTPCATNGLFHHVLFALGCCWSMAFSEFISSTYFNRCTPFPLKTLLLLIIAGLGQNDWTKPKAPTDLKVL